jgi:hypothetical protein
VILASLVGGCSSGGDEGILIVKDVSPSTGCMFLGESTEASLASGVISTLSPAGYLAAPQMQSRIISDTDDQLSRTVITDTVNVQLTFADPTVASALSGLPADLTHFSVPMSVPLPPVIGGELTVADGTFELIPLDVITALANMAGSDVFSTVIDTQFQVLGTMSGEEVDSQKFDFGVTVANNVVVDVVGTCPVATATNILDGNSCNPFQDGEVTCCTQNNELICPAVTM